MPLARAVAAFGRGRYADAVAIIAPMRANAHRFGGSHAQRDIVHLTLTESALRAGHASLAGALAAERTNLKRTSPFNWRLAARALDAQGRAEDAGRAREAADTHSRAHQAPRATTRAAA